ncbi:MAG: MFS transporter [DPANN group archaeon]|nr:MFS transporter [DPANN group archaeon]
MLHLKHRIQKNQIGKYAIIVLIFASAGAFISPIYSLFIKRFVIQDNLVGVLISCATIFAIFASIFSSKLIKKYGKIKTLKTTTISASLLYLSLTLVKTTFSLTIIEILRTTSITIAAICLGLLIKDISKKSELDKAEGLTYAFSNIGWFIAPILGGFLANIYGFDVLFIIASMLMLVTVVGIDSNQFKEHNYTHTEINLKEDIIAYFTHNSELKHIYIVSLGLSMFYITTVTYLPLILSESNITTTQIGFIMSLLIVPLLLFEYPVGLFAKKQGDQKLITRGFLIITISTLAMYVSYNNTTIFIMSMLLGYIGAAMIEPLKDAYFIKRTPKEHTTSFWGVYKTSHQIGSIIGPLIASIAITFMTLNGMFLIFIPLFGYITYISSKLKN